MVTLLQFWLLINSLLSCPSTDFAAIEAEHPFYVSVTEINHNAATNALEISCKIFTDDFEVALNHNASSRIDLFNPRDQKVVETRMAAYMKNHLLIFIDGRRVDFNFVGYERESEAIWSYYEVLNCPAPKTIELKNAILYDSFKEQINLMHVTVGGKRQSGKVDYPKTTLQLDFRSK